MVTRPVFPSNSKNRNPFHNTNKRAQQNGEAALHFKQEVTKIYNIMVEAENQEEAVNVGMNYSIEKWTDNQTGSSTLVYVKAEPKGHSTTKYRRQKWIRHRDYWVRRNLRV